MKTPALFLLLLLLLALCALSGYAADAPVPTSDDDTRVSGVNLKHLAARVAALEAAIRAISPTALPQKGSAK